jgi:hypothetical protein
MMMMLDAVARSERAASNLLSLRPAFSAQAQRIDTTKSLNQHQQYDKQLR